MDEWKEENEQLEEVLPDYLKKKNGRTHERPTPKKKTSYNMGYTRHACFAAHDG